MEFRAILYRLRILKGRFDSVKEYSIICLDMEFDNLKNVKLQKRKHKVSIDIVVAWISDEKSVMNLF
ncbi:hypothetical protein [Wukongibacter baidiensis]